MTELQGILWPAVSFLAAAKMSFVPESVKQQLELCKGTGILDFGKTGLTEIPEQVGQQAAIGRPSPVLHPLEFPRPDCVPLAVVLYGLGKVANGPCV